MTGVIVVGSGPSGVIAAAALVEAGVSVTLIDYANEDRKYAPLIPPGGFGELRRSDPNQHRYFLGDEFEGIALGAVRVGAQLTPPRLHIARDTAERTPVDSETFQPTESLALGGLAAGWGAGAFPFASNEIKNIAITLDDLKPHYENVAKRIGISGARDDLQPFYGDLEAMMPPLDIDTNAETVLAAYERSRVRLNARGFYMGKARLAAASREFRGRGPHPLDDMDFWSDRDRAVYRPRWTLDELRGSPLFTFLDRRFAVSFSERGPNEVELTTRRAEGGEIETHRARALVLAAGTLGGARIVLRSLGKYGVRVPVLSNAYAYAALLNLRMLGKQAKNRRHSLSQLVAIHAPRDPDAGIVHAQLYSYRSLLTFKLMKEAPLGYREALRVMRTLMPAFAILGIHHEENPSPEKYAVLRRGENGRPDVLEIQYRPSREEMDGQRRRERELLRCFRGLGCIPIRVIRPGHGSSIHYAGTFPMSAEERELTCDAAGRLRPTRNVYLVDGSGFAYLPAKGLTFTMMANADRIATALAERIRTADRRR